MSNFSYRIASSSHCENLKIILEKKWFSLKTTTILCVTTMSSSLFRCEVKTFACKIVQEEIILQREWIQEAESKILVGELVQ